MHGINDGIGILQRLSLNLAAQNEGVSAL